MAAIAAMALLPIEIKIFAALLFLARYITVSVVAKKCATRLGEEGIAAWSPVFDFIEPLVRFIVRTTQPKHIYKWR